MATPIPTDKYEDNSKYAPSLLFYLPLVLTVWSNIGSTIAEVSQQSNEDKLNNILKRIGYRPIVEVYRRFILMIYDLLYLITMALNSSEILINSSGNLRINCINSKSFSNTERLGLVT